MNRFKTILFFLIALLIQSTTFAQVIDSFNDGEFVSHPAWSGATDSWIIVTDSDCARGVTGSNTLRLNVESGSGTVYLSTVNPFSWGTEQTWGFWIGRRDQAATISNNSIVWLWASESNLFSGTIDGYCIKFGDNSGDDEIVLQRVDHGTATNIITSSGAIPNGLTDYGFLVRVTRTNIAEWTLFTSPLPVVNGTGAVASDVPNADNTPINQGSTVDNTYTDLTNGYIGFSAVHSSSASARSSAEFDQFYFAQSSDASLPVQLYSFTAQQRSNAVYLKWITQSEVNNLGFYVLSKTAQQDSFHCQSPLLPGAGTSSHLNTYEYIDRQIDNGEIEYKLKQLDTDGLYHNYGPISINVKKKINLNDKTEDFSLNGTYPNPFNSVTQIEIVNHHHTDAYLNIFIYNVIGVVIRNIENYLIKAGYNQFIWDGRDDKGVLVPSGVYFVDVISKSGQIFTKKMLKID
ncbi:T9SS type A sorting domain-containing protein [candidate division KSB1 bacterium]|nr:T9SS type A sorting domain-containing protein [candidate division KSB1 bacterium]